MSLLPHTEPNCRNLTEPSLELDIAARSRSLGDGFSVRRVLPAIARRMLGPFVFFDHMGPVQLAPDHGLDVRPHPHINLATVTYLFEGEILHRDSIGSEQLISPGAVNWMSAGRGIAHSERSPAASRKTGPRVHGLQLWVALPQAHEEDAPSFQHHPHATIPQLNIAGAELRVVAGSAYGVTSPVQVNSELFYVDVTIRAGSRLDLPEEYAERAVYVVDGQISSEGRAYAAGTMLIFRKGTCANFTAVSDARVMLLGGAPLDGERYIYWNFVSSSKERLELAKQAWKNREFPRVFGDETEFIPLPAE